MHYFTYAACAVVAACGAIFIYLGLWCAAVTTLGRHAGITLIGAAFIVASLSTGWHTYT